MFKEKGLKYLRQLTNKTKQVNTKTFKKIDDLTPEVKENLLIMGGGAGAGFLIGKGVYDDREGGALLKKAEVVFNKVAAIHSDQAGGTMAGGAIGGLLGAKAGYGALLQVMRRMPPGKLPSSKLEGALVAGGIISGVVGGSVAGKALGNAFDKTFNMGKYTIKK